MMFTVSRSHNHHLIRQGAGVAVANGLSYGAAIKSLTSTPAEVFEAIVSSQLQLLHFFGRVVRGITKTT